MKYTYWQYKNKVCTGLEYVQDHLIGSFDGEAFEYQIKKGRSIYIIKLNKKDYDGREFSEYKVYDLDGPVGCLDRQEDFDYKGHKRMTIQEYWKKLLKYNWEMKNWIESRLIYND